MNMLIIFPIRLVFRNRSIMLNSFFYYFFVLIVIGCTAEFKNKEILKPIEIRILDDIVYLENSQVKINMKILNHSDTSYILFAFDLFHEGLSSEEFYTQGIGYASGTAVFIFNNDGSKLKEHEPDHEPMSFKEIDDVKLMTDRVYVEGAFLINQDSSDYISKIFSLKNLRPAPGKYSLFLIYYSGRNLSIFVSKNKQHMLESEYNAKTYEGWIKSNTVKLIVE
jgi:hypothetical protein